MTNVLIRDEAPADVIGLIEPEAARLVGYLMTIMQSADKLHFSTVRCTQLTTVQVINGLPLAGKALERVQSPWTPYKLAAVLQCQWHRTRTKTAPRKAPDVFYTRNELAANGI